MAKKARVINAQEAALNKRKQQFLRMNGINVKVDGNWGPWLELQYVRLTTKEKQYPTDPMGLFSFVKDKITGNSTYREEPQFVTGTSGEIRADNRSTTRRWLDLQLSDNHTPLGYAYRTVLPAAAVAGGAYAAGSALSSLAGRAAVRGAALSVGNAVRTAVNNTARYVQNFSASPAVAVTPTGLTVATVASRAVPTAEALLPAAGIGLLTTGAILNRPISYTPVWNRTLLQSATADSAATAPADSTGVAPTDSTATAVAAPAAPTDSTGTTQPVRPRRPRKPKKPTEPTPPEPTLPELKPQSFWSRLLWDGKFSPNTKRYVGNAARLGIYGGAATGGAIGVRKLFRSPEEKIMDQLLEQIQSLLNLQTIKKNQLTIDSLRNAIVSPTLKAAQSSTLQPASDSLNASLVDEINNQTVNGTRDSIDLGSIGI